MSHVYTPKTKDIILGIAAAASSGVLIGHLSAFLLHPRAVLRIHPGIRFTQAMYNLTRTVGSGAARGAGSAALEWFHTSAAGRAYFNRVTMQGGARAVGAKRLRALKPTPKGVAVRVAAVASGAILGAAIGIGVSKAIWGESGEETAREFYGGVAMGEIGFMDWWRTVREIPELLQHQD